MPDERNTFARLVRGGLTGVLKGSATAAIPAGLHFADYVVNGEGFYSHRVAVPILSFVIGSVGSALTVVAAAVAAFHLETHAKASLRLWALLAVAAVIALGALATAAALGLFSADRSHACELTIAGACLISAKTVADSAQRRSAKVQQSEQE